MKRLVKGIGFLAWAGLLTVVAGFSKGVVWAEERVVAGQSECSAPIEANPYRCDELPYKGQVIGRKIYNDRAKTPLFELFIYKHANAPVDLKSLPKIGLSETQATQYFGPGKSATLRLKYSLESGRPQRIIQLSASDLSTSSACSSLPSSAVFTVLSTVDLKGATDAKGLRASANTDLTSRVIPFMRILCRGVEPPTFYFLKVSSSPTPGVGITVAGDLKEGTAQTPFTRSYEKGTVKEVTLGAPAEDKEKYPFVQWVINGRKQPEKQQTVTASITGNVNAVAVYQGPVTLTVSGTDLSPDQTIQIAPPDLKKLGDGSAGKKIARVYKRGTTVTVIAPEQNSKKFKFGEWQEGGEKVSGEAKYTFTLDTNRTLVAFYPTVCPECAGAGKNVILHSCPGRGCSPCASGKCCRNGQGDLFCLGDPNDACPAGFTPADCPALGRGEALFLKQRKEIVSDPKRPAEERAAAILEVASGLLQTDIDAPWREEAAVSMLGWLGAILPSRYTDNLLSREPEDAWRLAQPYLELQKKGNKEIKIIPGAVPGLVEQVVYLSAVKERRELRQNSLLADIFEALPPGVTTVNIFDQAVTFQQTQTQMLEMLDWILGSAVFSQKPQVRGVDKFAALILWSKLHERNSRAWDSPTSREKAADRALTDPVETLPTAFPGLPLETEIPALNEVLTRILNDLPRQYYVQGSDQDARKADESDILESKILRRVPPSAPIHVATLRMAMRAAAVFGWGQLRELPDHSRREAILAVGEALQEDRSAPPIGEWQVQMLLFSSLEYLDEMRHDRVADDDRPNFQIDTYSDQIYFFNRFYREYGF